LTISDVYWKISDAFLFLTTSPGKAGLRVQTGDRHTRDYGAACRGPPVVRERDESRHSVPWDFPESYWDGEISSDESDVQKIQKLAGF
jgi:hypothetical protein